MTAVPTLPDSLRGLLKAPYGVILAASLLLNIVLLLLLFLRETGWLGLLIAYVLGTILG